MAGHVAFNIQVIHICMLFEEKNQSAVEEDVGRRLLLSKFSEISHQDLVVVC